MKFKFDHTNRWYKVQSRINSRKLKTKTFLGVWNTNGSFNLHETTQKREPTKSRILLTDSRVKLKENEKRDEHVDLS